MQKQINLHITANSRKCACSFENGSRFCLIVNNYDAVVKLKTMKFKRFN